MDRRVLILTSNYPRWPNDTTTPFIHDLAVDLVEHGWYVRVLAPHTPMSKRREILDGVDVHRFRYLLPERAQTLCYGGGALVNLRTSRRARAEVPALVAAEWAATTRALGERFDVVHAHWTLPQGFVAASTPYRATPRVLTVHGGDAFGMRGRLLDRFAARALRAADAVTVNSAATATAVHEIAGPDIATSLVPFGIDTRKTPKPELVAGIRRRHRRGNGPLLVFVGRVIEEKGVGDIIDAVSLLAPEYPDISAAIVGAGQDVQQMRDLATRQRVADRVRFAGWADPSEVPSWFRAADVVVAPSRIGRRGWAEGQGLSIIEAMAVGAPVISTTTGGIPETITDGETGLLVPPADSVSLAAVVRRLVDDPQYATEIAERARRSIEGRFDRTATAVKMAAIYDQVIGRR